MTRIADWAALAADPRTLVLGYNGRVEQFTRSPLHPRSRASAMRWIFSSLLQVRRADRAARRPRRALGASPDGRTLTFWLHQSAEMARRPARDGRRCGVLGRAVAAAAPLLPQHAAPLHRRASRLRGARYAHTVRVTTPRPYAALPAYLTATWASLFLIVPKHLPRRARRLCRGRLRGAPHRQRPVPLRRDHRGRPRHPAGQPGLLWRRAQGGPGDPAPRLRRTPTAATPSCAASSIWWWRRGGSSRRRRPPSMTAGSPRSPRTRSSTSG